MFVASPQRGELFIARRVLFFTLQLRRSAMLLVAPAKVPLPGFRSDMERGLWALRRSYKYLGPGAKTNSTIALVSWIRMFD